MPHITVKIWPGKAEKEKQALAEAVTQDVMKHLGASADSISVAIEEIESSKWEDTVYVPEIAPAMDKLYKKPGYKM
ncbi:tautomerase PptA [Martelella endophytica]|uniref:4-oxalocrotonate tautomerase n=1 Tax=Martelella endophytica TaxID=1486262 RepID=A0A0D5LR62_MAREN|nr:tautomerase PptA [Martelella endophytica]AJY46257.1 4-oxalocrotonate tautomerase [Martelella endophytica]